MFHLILPFALIANAVPHALALQRIATTPTSFRIELVLPEGYRFNSQAPSLLTAGSPEGPSKQIEMKNTAFNTTIATPTTPQFSITGEARVFFCEDSTEPQCFMKQISFNKKFDPDTPRLLQITIPDPKANK
jgi:hypothetical protein